jgi:hypothetical protein
MNTNLSDKLETAAPHQNRPRSWVPGPALRAVPE